MRYVYTRIGIEEVKRNDVENVHLKLCALDPRNGSVGTNVGLPDKESQHNRRYCALIC